MFGFGTAQLRERLTLVEHMVTTLERDNRELRGVIMDINRSMTSIRESISTLSGQELHERAKQQDQRIDSLTRELHDVDIKTTETASILKTYLQSLSRGEGHREAATFAVQLTQQTDHRRQVIDQTKFGDVDTGGGNFSGTGNNNENK